MNAQVTVYIVHSLFMADLTDVLIVTRMGIAVLDGALFGWKESKISCSPEHHTVREGRRGCVSQGVSINISRWPANSKIRNV